MPLLYFTACILTMLEPNHTGLRHTFSELDHGFESLGVGQSHHPEELGPATALV